METDENKLQDSRRVLRPAARSLPNIRRFFNVIVIYDVIHKVYIRKKSRSRQFNEPKRMILINWWTQNEAYV